MKISILIPLFNEKETISLILEKILSKNLFPNELEIIVIDDGSTDSSYESIKVYLDKIKYVRHSKNLGKGEALKSGFFHSTGDIILVQDADLEYSPEDYNTLLSPLIDQGFDIVIGSRCRDNLSFINNFSFYFIGGRAINYFFNFLSPRNIKDIHSGYKLATRKAWEKLNLKESGFNFCHEFTCKAILLNLNIKEISIQYSPRNFSEGKKIRFKDGVLAIKTILRFLRQKNLPFPDLE